MLVWQLPRNLHANHCAWHETFGVKILKLKIQNLRIQNFKMVKFLCKFDMKVEKLKMGIQYDGYKILKFGEFLWK